MSLTEYYVLRNSAISYIISFVFQGQIVNHTLTLISSFSNTLKLVSVKPYPLNDQFSFEPVSSETQLLPNEKVQVCALKCIKQ